MKIIQANMEAILDPFFALSSNILRTDNLGAVQNIFSHLYLAPEDWLSVDAKMRELQTSGTADVKTVVFLTLKTLVLKALPRSIFSEYRKLLFMIDNVGLFEFGIDDGLMFASEVSGAPEFEEGRIVLATNHEIVFAVVAHVALSSARWSISQAQDHSQAADLDVIASMSSSAEPSLTIN